MGQAEEEYDAQYRLEGGEVYTVEGVQFVIVVAIRGILILGGG